VEDVNLIKFLKTKDPTEVKVVLSQAKKGYYIVEGVLYFSGTDMLDHRRLVVSNYLRKEILDEYHNAPLAGHFTTKRMTQIFSQYFYWTGMRADVYKKCS